LLDQAVHVERSELLAPVLFAFDSDELDANGIAMLHQVAALLLHERKDIARLAIAAYADARGSSEYNRNLSRRRAERVRAWLIEHGIAPERLEVDAEGASHFIEPGKNEAEHQQNRRVVFRVLATEAK
jgi:outer membrane protein OmpA-like peptidoglycan-associated protein